MTDGKSSQRPVLSRRKFIAASGSAGALALAGCTSDSSGDDGSGDDGSGDDGSGELSGSITIRGSSTVYPLMVAMSEEFSNDHDKVNVDLTPTGSGAGFSNHFCVGASEFNNASRPIKAEEEQLCEDNDIDYVELVLATDAVTVVINNDNDFVDYLTVEELAQIWKADPAQTWSEIRDEWPDEEINRFGAPDTSGTYDYFISNVTGEEGGHTDDYQATEQDNSIAAGVAGDEYAIGYFGFAYWYQNQDQITPVPIDNGDGPVEPSLDTAASGEYQPLSRPLFTYPSVGALAEEHVAEFARFVVEQTTNEQLVANDVGYVPLTEDKQQEQMEKLEDAIETAQN
ncbi:PstS family phosphate ABC transporter substrate-binding protein [Halovenus marina]|uniref:PstS family phosphate ABC transporter substrate-binding protein n=1 Tax=Halovenus marina TaxID=3396621 RepID=UPI003F5431CA